MHHPSPCAARRPHGCGTAGRWALHPLIGVFVGVLTLTGCFPERGVVAGAKGAAGGADGAGDGGAGDGGDAGADSGSPMADLDVRGIAPDEGSTAGGEVGRIEVTGASDALTVAVGGVDAEVLAIDEDGVQIIIPEYVLDAGTQSSVVPVTLTDGDRVVDVPGGFRYWRDAGGEAIVLVQAASVRWVDLPAAEVAGGQDELVGWAATLTPGDVWPEALSWSLGTGGCGVAPPDLGVLPSDGAVELRDADRRSIVLRGEGDGRFGGGFAGAVGATEVASLSGATLDVVVNTSAWPAITAPGLLRFPADWSLDRPDMSELAVDFPQIDAFEVAWSGTTADWMVVHVRDVKGTAEVWCAVEDTGSVTLPASATAGFVSDWGTWDVELTVYALERNATTVQFNNGQLRVQAATGYRGRRSFFDWP